MTEIDLATIFSSSFIIMFFFKAFAFVFSLMYFVYSFIVDRQVKIMARTIMISDSGPIKRENLMLMISNIQVFIGLLTFIFSILVIFS